MAMKKQSAILRSLGFSVDEIHIASSLFENEDSFKKFVEYVKNQLELFPARTSLKFYYNAF
jgi:hypothetical protein